MPQEGARHANPVDAHVGQRLRLRRMALGMSQEQLANRFDITFQQIQKYENGVNRISAGRLYGFAQVLDCPVQYFYGNLPLRNEVDGQVRKTNRVDDRIGEFLRSRDGLKLIAAFTRITDESVRKAIIRLVCDVAARSNSPS